MYTLSAFTNKLFLLLKRAKRDFFSALFLSVLSFFAWRPLLQIIFRGNSYMYMLSYVQEWFWGRKYPLTGFSSAAAITGALFRVFFGANISLYLWTELMVMLGIGVLFYWFVRVFTKRSLVAFTAALIFTVSYFGNFDIQVNTCYCYFMERVLNVPFLILSLIFLQFFLERAQSKLFVISLIFYFIGVGLGHFSFLFTPIYLFYPFFWYVFKKRKRNDITKGAVIGLSYFGISILFLFLQQIHESGLGSAWTFQEFLLNPQKYHYVDNMLRQLVYWSNYPPLIRSFLDVPDFHQNILSVQNAIESTPTIVVAYIIASVVIYRKLPQQRPVLFSTMFAAAAIFFLNAYFGQYDIANQPGTNRYLYFPTFLLSMFWSLFLWATFWKKKSLLSFVGVGILIVYYVINVTLIHDNFRAVMEWNKPTKVMYEYILKTRDRLDTNTLVLAEYPAIKLQEAQFLTELVGANQVHYMSESLDVEDWRPFATRSSHILKLSYDKNCQCVVEERMQ